MQKRHNSSNVVFALKGSIALLIKTGENTISVKDTLLGTRGKNVGIIPLSDVKTLEKYSLNIVAFSVFTAIRNNAIV